DPISGSATVELRTGTNATVGTPLRSAVTGPGAAFTFLDLSPGSYTLSVSASGFVSGVFNATVTAGVTGTVNVVLAPVASNDVIRIVLTWGNTPPDLDAMLVAPGVPNPIYFGHPG